ncbi:MAG: response regulator transcription factor [Acidobacteria bacterium]|jgi:DNA-binding response OmpR family regulator|nr:response regulator transcription factor [Acidobacteriota bacterium]
MKLLIVEDEPSIATALADSLRLEGYDVHVVGDGVSAERAALAERFDLILLDIMLPQRDGLTVCRRLRSAGLRTPIIVVTARAQEVDKIVALELGADDYVTKPFSLGELSARIRAVLRRGAGAPSSQDDSEIWVHGTISVDFRRGEATASGSVVAFTATEFKLLRVFVKHRGEVVSLDRLMQLVWGDGISLTDRVVYTHVNNLRAKLDAAGAPDLITSVRGLGYRFDG